MPIQSLHDKQQIATYLAQNKYLHLYSLGDLDPFFWSSTIWFGNVIDDQIEAIILLYLGSKPATLIAFSENRTPLNNLLTSIISFLPSTFYAHLDLDLQSVLSSKFNLESLGVHYRMALINPVQTVFKEFPHIVQLSMKDLMKIQDLYKRAYPNNWFDFRMLSTNHYYGMVIDQQIVSIAGVHVYSPQYRVAALGNITTHPDFRGMGYATQVTSKLCRNLVQEDLKIGLNVKADNYPALKCYKKLGFEKTHTFEEFLVCSK